jgi:hypothetical protein
MAFSAGTAEGRKFVYEKGKINMSSPLAMASSSSWDKPRRFRDHPFFYPQCLPAMAGINLYIMHKPSINLYRVFFVAIVYHYDPLWRSWPNSHVIPWCLKNLTEHMANSAGTIQVFHFRLIFFCVGGKTGSRFWDGMRHHCIPFLWKPEVHEIVYIVAP